MRNQKILFVGIIFILYLFPIGISHSATIQAASCSQADVQTAINYATTGDKVVVPSGNCTWTTWVSVPNSKKITLLGAGGDSTAITRNTTGLVISLGRSGSRVTRLGFINGKIEADGYDFRIDHCKLYFTNWSDGISAISRSINPAVIPTGLIDNNELTNMRILVNGTNFNLNENNAQGGLWASTLNLGSAEAVYIENNTFFPGTGSVNAVDGNYSGRFVFRYNTMIGLQIEAHSVQGDNRSIRKWEIYGNIINNTGSNIYYPFRLRGGTGMVFYNSVVGNWTNDGIALDNVRSYSSSGSGGQCNGSSSWDGNQDATGYPCRDQIGRGGDSLPWTYLPAGAYMQTLVPAYSWLNRTEVNAETPFVVINSSENHIKANRDFYNYNPLFNGSSGIGCGTLASMPSTCTAGVGYWATNQSCSVLTGMVGVNPTTPVSGTLYKCTAKDTWTIYYTPYEYPHPIAFLPPKVSPPLNLRISK